MTIDWTAFTPWTAAAGGALIFVAAMAVGMALSSAIQYFKSRS
ncbi:hypothetical protein [Achromobacter sp. UMC71]|nr:hypothetical protein [Achromobacter sp. UMC71]